MTTTIITATRKNLVLFVANSPSLYSDVNPRRDACFVFFVIHIKGRIDLNLRLFASCQHLKRWVEFFFCPYEEKKKSTFCHKVFIWWHCLFSLLLTKKSHRLCTTSSYEYLSYQWKNEFKREGYGRWCLTWNRTFVLHWQRSGLGTTLRSQRFPNVQNN